MKSPYNKILLVPLVAILFFVNGSDTSLKQRVRASASLIAKRQNQKKDLWSRLENRLIGLGEAFTKINPKVALKLKNAKAGNIGDDSDYVLAVLGMARGALAALDDPTDCDSLPAANVGVINSLLCLVGETVEVNGYGTFFGSTVARDYVLRVSIPGGDYRYLAEIWAADTGQTKRRGLTVYRNESGSKYTFYFVNNAFGSSFDAAGKVVVDLTDPDNQTYDVMTQIQGDTSGNTWAQADAWRDWSNRFLAYRLQGTSNSSTGKVTDRLTVNFQMGGNEVTVTTVNRVGATYALAYGEIGLPAAPAIWSPDNAWQCAYRTSQDPDPEVSLYTIVDGSDTFAEALDGGQCSFVGGGEEASLLTAYSTVLDPIQSNLELFDNQTTFPLTWWNASDTAPTP